MTTIDGKDIRDYGVIILRDGANGFISFPDSKEPAKVDWPENDGLEVDYDNIVFAAKKFTVNYYLKGNNSTFKQRLSDFIELHFAPGNRQVYLSEFDKTFSLRFAGVSNYSQKRGFSVDGEKSAYINIDYVMDDPLQFLALAEATPTGSGILQYVELNGIDLSKFEIIVSDVYSSALQSKPKEPLLIESKYLNGQTADVATAQKKQGTDIVVKCAMTASNLATFWNNYNALFYQMTVKIELNLSAAGKRFYCYFKSMDGFKKRSFNQRIGVEFSLKFAATLAPDIIKLLASEDGVYIITEDGYFIDLS